jgi:hypothetical protein
MGHREEPYHALPNCRRRISPCIGVRVGRIWPNRSAISSAAHDWHGHCAAGAPGLVYRTQYLQAVPGQCCTCGRAPCLPWLPYGLPVSLLGLSISSGALRYWPRCAALGRKRSRHENAAYDVAVSVHPQERVLLRQGIRVIREHVPASGA